MATIANESQDPYYIAQQTIESSVRALSSSFDKWKSLVHTTNTHVDREFKWASRDLRRGIKNLDVDISDIEDSISVVEKFPNRFPLGPNELEKRKQFVNQVKQTLEFVKQEMNNPDVIQKIEADKRQELMEFERRQNIEQSSRMSGMHRAAEDFNNEFLRDQVSQQQALIAKQDEGLDQLGEEIQTLGAISKDMDSEIKLHTGLLDKLDMRVTNSSTALASLMRKLDRFMESTSSKTQWIMIAVLAVIFILLVVLSSTILKKK
eukprot:gene5609-6981_t